MNKLTALDSWKVIPILEDVRQSQEQMIRRLKFLDSIKGSAGGEMSEMMGDEITRVMEEQKRLETDYAGYIEQRGNLKGLANKRLRIETQEMIQKIALELKESTKNLCRVLKDKSDVNGNIIKIKRDKADLQYRVEELIGELNDISFGKFKDKVHEGLQKQQELSRLKEQEKELTSDIKRINNELKKAKIDFNRETNQANTMIQKLRKDVNEAKTETELFIKYEQNERYGKESCQTRGFSKIERELRNKIESLIRQKETELTVNSKIVNFLNRKKDELNDKNDEWEKKKLEETKQLDDRLNETSAQREETKEQIQKISDNIKQMMSENEERKELENKKMEEARLKQEEKVKMQEAARFIQAKWYNFKTNVTLKKKGKGKKGKKGKKKK